MVDPGEVLRSAKIARAWRSFRGLNYRMTQAWSTNWSGQTIVDYTRRLNFGETTRKVVMTGWKWRRESEIEQIDDTYAIGV